MDAEQLARVRHSRQVWGSSWTKPHQEKLKK